MPARILLLEDDPDLGEVTAAVLEEAGHEVRWTQSGEEAALLAARVPWDLVVLDVEVLQLSGLAVQLLLRDLDAAPSVVTSAQPDDRWMREAFAAGAAACLPKPFTPDDLLGLVDATLAARRKVRGRPGDVRALPPEDVAALARMSEEELDALPFGLIRIDDEGRVQAYNAYEARASGFAARDVIGMRFSDLAPCTLVKRFLDAVDLVKAHPDTHPVLRYLFPHHSALCVVSVRLFYDEEREQLWIFVSKREGSQHAGMPEGGWRERPAPGP